MLNWVYLCRRNVRIVSEVKSLINEAAASKKFYFRPSAVRGLTRFSDFPTVNQWTSGFVPSSAISWFLQDNALRQTSATAGVFRESLELDNG